MSRRTVLAAMACAASASACTSEDGPDQSRAPALGASSPDVPHDPLRPGPGAPVVQELWGSAEPAPYAWPLAGLTQQQLVDGAPLAASPGGSAIAAVGFSPWGAEDPAMPPGDVYVVGEGLVVRSVLVSRGRVEDVERPFALSPDGTLLATSGPGTITVIDLGTARETSFAVDAPQPVALTWSSGGERIDFVERDATSRRGGSRLDLGSGRVAALPFNPINSLALGESRVVTVTESGELSILDGGREVHRTPTRAPRGQSLMLAMDTSVVTLLPSDPYDYTDLPGGPAVLDLDSGDVVACLPMPEEEMQLAGVVGWGPSGSVRFTAGPTGRAVYDWNVAAGTLAQVDADLPSGILLDVAAEA